MLIKKMVSNLIKAPIQSVIPIFEPIDILGTQIWVDATDKGSVVESSNDVSNWKDKSLNRNDALQTVGLDQPLANTETINDQPAIDFDGVDHYLKGGILDLSTGRFSIACVFEPNVVVGEFILFSVWEDGAGSRIQFYQSGDGIIVTAGSSQNDFIAKVAFLLLSVNTPVLITVVFDPSPTLVPTDISIYMNGVIAIFVGGLTIGSPTSLTTSSETYEIGAQTNGTERLYGGSISELVVSNRTWFDSERIELEQHLLAKYSI